MPFHPRNKHQGHYELAQLTAACPELEAFVLVKKDGALSLDFGQSKAVFYLNKALLATQYALPNWSLPEGALCPPVPSRADYLHHLADLLSHGASAPPRGSKTCILDIGTGANCIYPILGTAAYRWSFIGVEHHQTALRWAHAILMEHKRLRKLVQLRWQPNPQQVFKGIIRPQDQFAASICNPPFFGSAQEAVEQQQRKWKQLHPKQPSPNFGGQAHELYYEHGGEVGFIKTMIEESQHYKDQIRWFTTLVSQEKYLNILLRTLKTIKVERIEIILMKHGNKQSRVLCWSY
jgi:23S rRNA (adenine1618-N6)-methyltransferase